MKDKKTSVKEFEDITNVLKEYLKSIEELKNKDKMATMVFVLQQKEMFKANKENSAILENGIKKLNQKLTELNKSIALSQTIKLIISNFSERHLEEFKNSLKEELSEQEIENIFNVDKFLNDANKVKNDIENLISQMQECLNQIKQLATKEKELKKIYNVGISYSIVNLITMLIFITLHTILQFVPINVKFPALVITVFSIFTIGYIVFGIFALCKDHLFFKDKYFKICECLEFISMIFLIVSVSLFFIFSAYNINFNLGSKIMISIYSLLLWISMFIKLFYKEKLFKEDKNFAVSIAILICVSIAGFLNFYSISWAMILISVILSIFLTAFILKMVLINKIQISTFKDIFKIIVLILLDIIANLYLIYLLFWNPKAQSQDLFTTISGVYGCVIGGILTLAGVAWTIKFTSKENNRQDVLKVRPIMIYTTNKCYGYSEFHSNHIISVSNKYEDIRFYLFKNIGQTPFKIDIDSVSEKTNWILPDETFALGLRIEKTEDIINLKVIDILDNAYNYEISFNNVFRIASFKILKEE